MQVERDKPVAEDEIEVTEEMRAAGARMVAGLLDQPVDRSMGLIAEEIFLKMLMSRA